MVLAQDQMLASVYWHPTTRALFAMFHRFLDIVVGKNLDVLRDIVTALKGCSNEYEAMHRILIPRAEKHKYSEDALRLIGLHREHDFKQIYIPIKRYAWADATHPQRRSFENIYSRIVKQNLTAYTRNLSNPMPIDWLQVKRLRQSFIEALDQKKVTVSQNDILIDVPWGKPSNREVVILRSDNKTEIAISKMSHLAETIFALPTAHIAPVGIYLRPDIYARAKPSMVSIISAAEEIFDGKGPVDIEDILD